MRYPTVPGLSRAPGRRRLRTTMPLVPGSWFLREEPSSRDRGALSSSVSAVPATATGRQVPAHRRAEAGEPPVDQAGGRPLAWSHNVSN